jgi:hypothetical protein
VAGVGTNIFASTGLSAYGDTGGGGSDSAALASATYGPAAAGSSGPFSPGHSVGAGFWFAVAGVVVLVFIRQSLPR